MSVTDVVGERILNGLLQYPREILYFYYRSNSEGSEVAQERARIKDQFYNTILRGYTSTNYTTFRIELIGRAIEVLVINLLKEPLTIDQINESDSLILNNYELNQSRQFNNFIRSLLSEIPDQTGDFILKLRKHQEIAKQYMIQIPSVKRQMIVTNRPKSVSDDFSDTQDFLNIEPLTPYRGVLLYHDMGTGKTLTGVHLAIGFLDSYRFPLLKLQRHSTNKNPVASEPKGKVIFMFFKRLYHTWSQSVYRYLNEAYDLEKYFLELFDLADINEFIKKKYKKSVPKSAELYQELKQRIIDDGSFQEIKHQIINLFIRDHIVFMPSNANNRLLERIKTPLKHNLLVIDEIHNIISYIHSSIMSLPGRPAGKIGNRVYQWLMDSIDTKIVGLSGTPITNYPEELLILANVLRGKMNIDSKTQSTIDDELTDTSSVIFPLQRELIRNLLFAQNGEILNPLLISRRISGLISRKIRDPSSDYPVSYWSDTLPWNNQPVPWADEKSGVFNPATDSILSLSIGKIRKVNVAFSEKQYVSYNKVKDKPTSYSFEEMKGYALIGKAFAKSLGMCTYPLDSSLLYEIKLEDNITTTPSQGSAEDNKFIYHPDRVADDSPKIARILSTVLDPNNHDLHFVYSRTIIYGAFHLEGYLQANGFQQYRFKKGSETDPVVIAELVKIELEKLARRVKKGKKYYIKYTDNYQFIRNGKAVPGPKVETGELIDTINYIFNNDQNRFGQLIKLLIGTEKAKEGLDLRHVRQVYIMDPWWNMVNPEQAMGRAIRYLSHYREEMVPIEPEQQSEQEQQQSEQEQQQSEQEEQQSDNDQHNFKLVASGFENIADRYVKIDLMIGVFSEDQLTRIRSQRSNTNTTTTDELAFSKAMNKLIVSQQIEQLLNKSAIDCGLYQSQTTEPVTDDNYSKDCLQIFSPTDIGLAYSRNIMNDLIDIEFNETRDQSNIEFYQIEYEGEQLYRKVNIELIPIEFQAEGGLKIEKSELILYRKYADQGSIIPAYAFVRINDTEYRQIKYPAFKIAKGE